MRDEYEYGTSFQLKLLSLLIRKPEKVARFIHPRYFDIAFVDIAREVVAAYADHPKSCFTRPTLIALLMDKLGSRKWRIEGDRYKRIVREMFEGNTDDDDLVAKRAMEFARDRAYRAALVHMEELVNRKNFEAAERVLPEMRAELVGNQAGQYDWNSLPRRVARIYSQITLLLFFRNEIDRRCAEYSSE